MKHLPHDALLTRRGRITRRLLDNVDPLIFFGTPVFLGVLVTTLEYLKYLKGAQ